MTFYKTFHFVYIQMSQRLFDFEKLKKFSNREFLIHRISQDEEIVYSYGKIIAASQAFAEFLRKIISAKARISLQCSHSPELCVILLSILNCGCSFCPISHDANEDESVATARKYSSALFISHNRFLESKCLIKLVGQRTIINTKFYVFIIPYERNNFEPKKQLYSNECYSIKTSGSTGFAKVVRVPYQCIDPNINGLSDLLEITSKDLIFMSSPVTFDPFVVEYFLALRNGASLLITSPSIRFEPHKLVKILQPKLLRGASVVQTTPSLFRLFGSDAIRKIILSSNTSIRILLLGGERFPSIDEILQWTALNNCKTRVFNIYGITEVSCWSTAYEIKRIKSEKCIPIGISIDSETQIRLVNDINEVVHEGFGDIQIGSASRKCMIDGEKQIDIFSTDILFRSTGDIGFISEGNIFYEGRKNEMIKRYGHRVDTGYIEKTILMIDGVINTCCVFNDHTMRLICFISKNDNKTKRELQIEILKKLKNIEKPDDIKFVDYFPVTSHGKISKKKLLLLYERFANNTPIQVFERFITNVLCYDLDCYRSVQNTAPKKQKILSDISFLDLGGTSIQALTLSTQIGNILQRPDPKILEMMLNGTTPISSMLEYINNINLAASTVKNVSKCIYNRNTKDLIKIKWQYDTGKCVDGAPTCRGNVVCVGSHSHLLVTVDAKSGQKVSTCILPDRIECQASFIDHRLVVVGCYDGILYAVDYLCGKIEWQFDCCGMIKARPLRNGNLVVVGNYSTNGNLLCINISEQKAVWKVQIGSKGIFASPLQIDDESLLACTLTGETVCVTFKSGHVIWKTIFKSPIFSTPTKLTENAVLIAEVSGVVHCLTLTSGIELWNFQTDGNIFSSIIVHKITDDTFIFFGNHDHNIYCLKSTQPTQEPSIVWKSELNSAIYSNPVILQVSADMLAVLSCSTKGGIYIINFYTGSVLFLMNLDNEIFSSPCIMDNRIYIGCRNNNLVCLELLQHEKQINDDNL